MTGDTDRTSPVGVTLTRTGAGGSKGGSLVLRYLILLLLHVCEGVVEGWINLRYQMSQTQTGLRESVEFKQRFSVSVQV